MEIQKVEVNWYEGYGNSPELKVYVDQIHSLGDFKYDLHEHDRYDVLLSTNLMPWAKFVMVDRKYREGSPIQGGALGGNYPLTDGTEYVTRTGWSSRASVINGEFKMELLDVVVYTEPTKAGWAGFALDYSEAIKWLPDGVYLAAAGTVKEPIWVPSTEQYKIVKPNGMVIDR